ncbi:MAG: hypothetical protein Tp118SUR00d2C21406351_8 [Prokaryotic dsDNA virus sp.]|nr:MAG: hypothetical protein Tp118SUR00d2C21406351_8 [Prokaryotic dsDNA virus sp.]
MPKHMKRWQWWVALVILAIPLCITTLIHYIGVFLEFTGDKLRLMDFDAPKWMSRVVDWGVGE